MFGWRRRDPFKLLESKSRVLRGYGSCGQLTELPGTVTPLELRGRNTVLNAELSRAVLRHQGGPERRFLSDSRSVARLSGLDCDHCLCRMSPELNAVLVTGCNGVNHDLTPEGIVARVAQLPCAAEVIGASDRWIRLSFSRVTAGLEVALAELSPDSFGSDGSDERKAFLRDLREHHSTFLVWY